MSSIPSPNCDIRADPARHAQERNIADTGLNLLLEMLQMFERSDFATQFHKTYFMTLVQEIFAVMTGGLPQCHCTAGIPVYPCSVYSSYHM